ncbi:MAG: hypothetical protein PGN29_12775 [Gordonia paraffinivorans]
MRTVRTAVALVALAGLAAVVWVLGVPGWLIAPAVALAVVVVGLWVVGVRSAHPGRLADIALVGLAAATAIAAIVVALTVPRSAQTDDASLRGRTAEAVTAYLTIAPGADDPDAVATRLRTLTPLLTDRALADLRSQGPDAALAGAVATSATQQVVVQSVGVAERHRDSARLLVYAALRATIPRVSPDAATSPVARWAVMRRVDGTWRLADLYPVGPGG